MTLPSSHNVSGDLTKVGDYPISVDGGTADVWEGTHGGRTVCIKCPRVSEEDLQSVTRVRVQHRHAIFASTQGHLDITVIPQRGRHMEKVKTFKYRSFHRCYKGPFAICIRVLAEWDSDKVRQEESERRPDYPGESSLCSDGLTDNAIFPSCWMWQKVSTTFTQTIRYTET